MAMSSKNGNSAVLDRTDEQMQEEALAFEQSVIASRTNRRKLISNLTMAAGAVGALGLAGCSSAGPAMISTVPTGSPSVADVLNFALNLEYFEASFYSYVVTGSGLSAADMGPTPGTVMGIPKITFTNSYMANIAANLMTEEVLHVQLLRATIQTALGVTPVSIPSLNLAPSTALTANSDATFAAIARQVEGVGVSAYAGGAQYLTSNVAALNYAAQILDVEAQHSGALRLACIKLGVTSPAADALDLVPSMSQIFNTNNSTGLNPVRTPQQVLGIVYGVSNSTTTTPPAGVVKGGFFPNGLNGNIFST